jgi:hypothetical protein
MLPTRQWVLQIALAAGLIASGTAISGTDADQKVERLTDAVVRMLPLGAIFDGVAAKEPTWPMLDKPDAVTPGQLACLRNALSSAGYRRSRREDVAAYVAANPSRIDGDLKLLEGGAATIFGQLVSAGAEQTGNGPARDPREVLKSATSEQALAFITLFSDPNYAGLRKLSGVGDALNLAKSAEENEASGKQLGASLAAQQMMKAAGTCAIPPTAFL